MNKVELSEAIDETGTVLDALLLTLHGKTGIVGANLSYLSGRLRANGALQLNAGGYDFWFALTACFDAAVSAGATFETIEAVRVVANGIVPMHPAGVAVKNFCIRMALVEQARILAATNFVSRQDVDRYFDKINASFEDAEHVAAANHDNIVYVALIEIHATVSNDLATRSRPLPLMIAYTFPDRMPSLWLAQRIYYDPSRYAQLIDENKPIHPLFMPATGAALSA